MSLPALPVTADTRSITERVNVLIRDYNTLIGVPAGCVMPFAGATAPDGWLLCYGQAVSRTAYADLFAALGTTYGAGDGSSTFNLPDLRGRVVAGKDDMGGSAASRLTSGGQASINGATLGAAGGAQDNTLDTSRMPAHSHSYNDAGHAHFITGGDSTPASFTGRAGQGDGLHNYSVGTTVAATGISINSTGGGGAHNNTQPTIVLNHIIST